jgi:hypothetical protein
MPGHWEAGLSPDRLAPRGVTTAGRRRPPDPGVTRSLVRSLTHKSRRHPEPPGPFAARNRWLRRSCSDDEPRWAALMIGLGSMIRHVMLYQTLGGASIESGLAASGRRSAARWAL